MPTVWLVSCAHVLTKPVRMALQDVRDRLILHGHDYFNGCPNGAFFNYRTERECCLTPLSKACLRTQCDKASHAHKLWRSGREGLCGLCASFVPAG